MGMHQYTDHKRLMAAYADMSAGRFDAARATLASLVSEGETRALLYLGWMHERGLGNAVDEQKAADCYSTLCAQNDPDACYYAASLMFRRGDIPGALESYVRAADMGHPSAAYWASAIFDGDGGLQPDPQQSAKYLKLAAESGHMFARRDLAKQQVRTGRGLWDKILASVKYMSALLRGLALLAKNADDPRVR
jgi:TPR repeat protein